MGISKKELRDYCQPFLKRAKFKFKNLNGMVEPAMLKDLRLAKAFAYPGEDARNFIFAKSGAAPHLKEPIDREIQALMDKPGVSNNDRFETMDRIRDIFIEHGIHSSFERPGSLGMILHQREISGLPAYFYLGESRNGYTGRGRLDFFQDGSGSFQINVSETASRLVQVLDFWLATREEVEAHPEEFRLSLIRVPEDILMEAMTKRFKASQLTREEIPVLFALDVSALRLMIARLQGFADSSSTPRGFLLKALNHHLDSAVAHETAHHEEKKAHGLCMPHSTEECIAYLLQAIYAEPGDAFRSLMLRQFDVTEQMPSFDSAVRDLGPGCFCVPAGFFEKWATLMVDAMFKAHNGGRSHGQVVSAKTIVDVQSSDYVGMESMPLVERAMCNPNLRLFT